MFNKSKDSPLPQVFNNEARKTIDFLNSAQKKQSDSLSDLMSASFEQQKTPVQAKTSNQKNFSNEIKPNSISPIANTSLNSNDNGKLYSNNIYFNKNSNVYERSSLNPNNFLLQNNLLLKRTPIQNNSENNQTNPEPILQNQNEMNYNMDKIRENLIELNNMSLADQNDNKTETSSISGIFINDDVPESKNNTIIKKFQDTANFVVKNYENEKKFPTVGGNYSLIEDLVLLKETIHKKKLDSQLIKDISNQRILLSRTFQSVKDRHRSFLKYLTVENIKTIKQFIEQYNNLDFRNYCLTFEGTKNSKKFKSISSMNFNSSKTIFFEKSSEKKPISLESEKDPFEFEGSENKEKDLNQSLNSKRKEDAFLKNFTKKTIPTKNINELGSDSLNEGNKINKENSSKYQSNNMLNNNQDKNLTINIQTSKNSEISNTNPNEKLTIEQIYRQISENNNEKNKINENLLHSENNKNANNDFSEKKSLNNQQTNQSINLEIKQSSSKTPIKRKESPVPLNMLKIKKKICYPHDNKLFSDSIKVNISSTLYNIQISTINDYDGTNLFIYTNFEKEPTPLRSVIEVFKNPQVDTSEKVYQLSRKYNREVQEIIEILKNVSGNIVDLEKFLENENINKKLAWSPEEDELLKNLTSKNSLEYNLICKYKDLDKIKERLKYKDIKLNFEF